jgi:hypothetical protein
MTALQKWNRIVELYERNLNTPEVNLQEIWENIFAEILGYSRLENEIEKHRIIPIGSTERAITDVIIKDGNTDLYVVELKQHNLPISKAMEGQLLSYLKLLRLDIGILICNKLYIYNYSSDLNDDDQFRVEIDFNRDCIYGIRFVELFGKQNFCKASVKELISNHITSEKNIEIIKRELTPQFLMDLSTSFFSEKYQLYEVEKAISSVVISVTNKQKAAVISLPQKILPDMRISDNSNIKIGKLAQTMLRTALENGKATEEEVNKLQQKAYSKEVFGINYPLLVQENSNYDSVRYYKFPVIIYGMRYRMCSQWFETSLVNNRPQLTLWLDSHGTL